MSSPSHTMRIENSTTVLERKEEEEAPDSPRKITASKRIKNSLSAFITFMAGKCGTFQHTTPERERTEMPSIDHDAIGDDLIAVPELQPITAIEALGMLEFRKAFLILSYVGSKKLDEIISANTIILLKGLPMVSFEREIWNVVEDKNCIPESDRIKNVDWDSRNTHMYHCHVDQNGGITFKGPYVQNTSTHLHRVLGDDNVLLVKFAAEGNRPDLFPIYRRIAKKGIVVGLRRYRFFVFKYGGKDNKKSLTSSSVNCYFVRTESKWSMDMTANEPYILCKKSIQEARCIFMHVHTVSSVAKYMARFSLILSKTMELDVNFASVNIRWIEDIACMDEDGQIVRNEDGEVMIHTDGTGFISEDLAKRCPRRIYKGHDTTSFEFLDEFGVARTHSSEMKLFSLSDELPLLIQVRLFYNGYAVKGTLLVDKRLPPQTICVRHSMIKVKADPNTLPIKHCNSLEVVGTSNLPRRTYLSKSIIALLHYGGVPKEYFIELLMDAMSNAVDARCHKRSALRVALMHGNMDDLLLVRMILCGIPLDEPYLQFQLSVMMREEWNNLKGGKIPVNGCYYLMGTTDPIGILEPNEVCIILDNGQVSGDVLVYKHPGLHFGDVHKLTAVFVKDMEKVVGSCKYAIFFPTKGPRSLADEMANGDYDGDLYWVSTNSQLIQNFKASTPWKWRHSKPKVPQEKKPTAFSSEKLESVLFNNFLKYGFTPSHAMSDAADSWMAYMDRLLTSTVCAEEKQCLLEKILELIDIYYLALDAPKKGLKVEVPKHLKADRYPHFLERSKPSYKSTSILGEIYDKVASFQVEDRQINEVQTLPYLNEQAPHYCLNLWGKRYDDYRNDMTHALREKKENLKKSAADQIIQKYKRMLYDAEDFENSSRNREDIFDEALAIYQIVYGHVNYQENKKGSSCGFAWRVAGHALCELYVKKQSNDSTVVCLKSVLQEIL